MASRTANFMTKHQLRLDTQDFGGKKIEPVTEFEADRIYDRSSSGSTTKEIEPSHARYDHSETNECGV